MVIDTSAIISIYSKEQGHQLLLDRLYQTKLVLVGTPTLVEAVMVLSRWLDDSARLYLKVFLRHFEIEIIPFTPDHSEAAMNAFIRFGKGRHPAALNLSDCFSYAVASVARMPLLFAGNDFTKTDIKPALQ